MEQDFESSESLVDNIPNRGVFLLSLVFLILLRQEADLPCSSFTLECVTFEEVPWYRPPAHGAKRIPTLNETFGTKVAVLVVATQNHRVNRLVQAN